MVLDREKIHCTEFSFILAPSILGGIGVFAAHDIPQGALLFSGKHAWRTLKRKEIPPDFLKYCIFINDEECRCPERFDRIEIGWYINHSHHPNIGKINTLMYALRDIKAKEEILIDYNELNEPEHLKEAYYKVSSS